MQSVALVSEALVKCQGAIKAAEFDATNPFFKSKYATLGSVIAASREALFKAGLAVLQVPTIEGDKVSVHTRLVHCSGQSLDCGVMSLPLEGNDRNSDAQVAGSILTYLKRYAWASVLGIYADSDDDGNSGPKGAVPRQQPLKASGAPATAFNADKARMKALNLLLAAPGQPNRNLFKDYLLFRGWIKANEEVEALPEQFLPHSPEDMAKLSEDVQRFHMEQARADLKEELI